MLKIDFDIADPIVPMGSRFASLLLNRYRVKPRRFISPPWALMEGHTEEKAVEQALLESARF